MIIQKKAYAKINLYLEILDKLPNGYHNIRTLMQKISLCDDLKINITRGTGKNINVTCEAENIPTGRDNIVYKAAELFFDSAKISADIIIDITKKIPSQAGLGGGSSDAGSVLLALNEYFEHILPESDMLNIAAKVGADVPFFVKNTSCAVCEGVGEIITPVYIDLSGFCCLIAKPVYDISTKRAFLDWDGFRPPRQHFVLPPLHGGEFRLSPGVYLIPLRGGVPPTAAGWLKNIRNDFEGLIFSQNKNIGVLKNLIAANNSAAAGLSGSGSALFGIFADLNDAQKCRVQITQRSDIEFCGIFDFLC